MNWNVLTDSWLDVMNLDAKPTTCSPLEALRRASDILCITAASPLDLFAAHRFLLTLLYWKADETGGVPLLREALLKGKVPNAVQAAIEAESPLFNLCDARRPFLQDTTVAKAKLTNSDMKSAGSLFTEFASGTNIAHFHHGDDDRMRLCLRCATVGLLRVVPWSQSGGAGITPAVHSSPPIMVMASGETLAVTLGLNLVPLGGSAGKARWTGHFAPTDKNGPIEFLEALTWNPRRIHLLPPQPAEVCWRCGQAADTVVGPIVYLKNEETKKRSDGELFDWHDPSAFYTAADPRKTVKSSKEDRAAPGRDLFSLLHEDKTPTCALIGANGQNQSWRLIIPCTDNKAKTYDHRQLALTGPWPDALRVALPAGPSLGTRLVLDGWQTPRRSARAGGATAFVRAAARHLTHGDWNVLAAAAGKQMHESPAAFDLFSGIRWALRGKVSLPSKPVGWLLLKLMACVPAHARIPRADGFSPLESLPKQQASKSRKTGALVRYPVSLPRGPRLETYLRDALDTNLRKRVPQPFDWAGLCDSLGQLLD